ncbi:MAG: PilZ domain-containing protein [Candidatus Electrothrix sp. GM3_4]|nr:PilZ domain-containing protein [Candidatus Electrothrix sp. GM3_4]
MDANNGILCPIPEDERTPFVDVLLKFIDWQKVRIENAEEENKKLKKEIVELKKKGISESRDEKSASDDNRIKRIEKVQAPKKNITPLKIQQQDAVKQEDIQQLLVKNIQQLLVNIGHKNKRQFTRLQVCLDADLDFGSQRYYRHSVEDISLGGFYVKGRFDQRRQGDICTICLNQSEVDMDLEIHATCSVIRGSVNGMALEFLSMKLDDFCHLQTVLLYEADDPFVLGTEFVNHMNLELENDLILCHTFHFHQDKEGRRIN